MMLAGALKDPNPALEESQVQPNGHVDKPSPAQQHDHTHSHEDDASAGGSSQDYYGYCEQL